jgi:hypothetical protein
MPPNEKSERWRRPLASGPANDIRPPPFAPLTCSPLVGGRSSY